MQQENKARVRFQQWKAEVHEPELAAELENMSVQQQSVLFGDEAKLDLPIVYTPLHGTGYAPVMKMLGWQGFTKIYPVRNQS